MLTSACSEQGTGCGAAGFRDGASGRGLGLTAFRHPEGAGTAQQRQTRKTAGFPWPSLPELSPYTPAASPKPLSLPGATDQVSPNKQLLSSACVWWSTYMGERQKSKGGPQTNVEPRACMSRARKGNPPRNYSCSGLNSSI